MKLLNFYKNLQKTRSKTKYFNFLKLVKSKGYKLKYVYDIGALKGSWSQRLLKEFRDIDVTLFEANPAYVPNLIATGFKFFNVALSNPGREIVDFYNGTNSGDSYYKETTLHYENQNTIRLKCDTLDNIVIANKLAYPNFIKIDTQGSELDILIGGIHTLQHTDFVLVECPIIEYNKGAPVISDYLSFFKKNYFIPFDIYEIHRSEDTLLQIDIMFMRQNIKEKYFGSYQFIKI